MLNNDLFTRPTVLSLFDHSGRWAAPYADAGYNVECIDIKNGRDVQMIRADEFANVVGILSAPPCTAFSGSGAQYWGQKDADGTTGQALALVDAVYRLVGVYKPAFWVLENPVGRLKHYIGPPQLWFNPCDFGGYLNAAEIETETQRLIDVYGLALDVAQCAAANAYTKKTGLWGNFNADLKTAPVEPIIKKDKIRNRSYSPIHMATGGKSERTKELRSITPLGFARAFFAANNPANL